MLGSSCTVTITVNFIVVLGLFFLSRAFTVTLFVFTVVLLTYCQVVCAPLVSFAIVPSLSDCY